MSDNTTPIDLLLQQLTLEEKVSLTVGRDSWTTNSVERLGIPSVWLSDGPTGLRRSPQSDSIGIGDSEPATCFPTASALASSWDRDVMAQAGKAIGIEAQAQGVQVLLGPGLNQKRSPLGGRNFEYLSEDPVLTGELAAAFIGALQAEGVGASPKHFVANESETGRMYVDTLIDERTLRENYLRPFEIAIRKSNPWTIMESYNKVNGVFVAENKRLLHDILHEEWGYRGIVMSDWIAVNDRVAGIDAGLHLQMPYGKTEEQLIAAVKDGTLAESRLDEIVREMLAFVLKADAARKPETTYSEDEHHALARKIAAECVTLLQNEGDLLPLSPSAKVAVIGEFAQKPRYQGGGSSMVVPTRVDSLYTELSAIYGNDLPYAPGYEGDSTSDELIAEAVNAARDADIAVVVIGLPDTYENEGADREHIDLPDAHNTLVSHIHEVQPNTVVVLINGSAVDLTWVSYVPAIVEGWLTGQAGGGAIADVLTGRANPSGKLAETFPYRLEDTPAYTSFWPDANNSITFDEGVFTGYRWYDTRDIEPMFPFGYGLSYTSFAYSDLRVSSESISEGETLEVTVTVTNTGDRAGKETVQLYVHEHESRFSRAVRELKDFAKVEIEAGESKDVTLRVAGADLAQWDIAVGGWVVNTGAFDVLVGSSSRDLHLQTTVQVTSLSLPKKVYDRMSPMGELMKVPAVEEVVKANLPPGFTQATGADMLMNFMYHTPVSKLVIMGMVTEEQLAGLLAMANSA